VLVAYRKALFALSASPGPIPEQYPILGPFVSLMRRLGEYTEVDIHHKPFRIRVGQCPQALDVDSIHGQIARRYDISATEIQEFHRMLAEIHTIPVLVKGSPVFSKLCADYA
jgi:hypothetical protein